MCVNELLRDIEICRSKMVYLAAHTSLCNEQVVEISTELDHLLNKYYTLTFKK